MVLKLIAAVGILTVVFLSDDGSANQYSDIDASLYPVADRDDSMQYTYGDGSIKMPDPYNWLEEPDSDKTKEFVKKESDLTEDYLKNIEDSDKIKARYAELWKIEKYEGPFHKGNKYFSYRSKDSDKQDIIYVHDEPIAEGRIFLDPNKLERSVTLQKTGSAFSEDGKIFAYLTSESDSDWNTLRFKHLEEKDLFNEKLIHVKHSKVTWTKNNDAIFYSSYGFKGGASSSGAAGDKIYHHVLGTDQDHDLPVAQFPNNPDYIVSSDITDDGKYLIVTASQDSKNIVSIGNLEAIGYEISEKSNLKLDPLVSKMEAKYDFITNFGTKLIFLTNKGADNNKLVVVDINKPDTWTDLVKEDNNRVLDWAKPAWNKYLVLGYIAEDIRSVLQLHDIESGDKKKTYELGIGTVKAESFYSNKQDSNIYFKFESFFTPCIIYNHDLKDTTSDINKAKEITVPNFEASDYTSEFVTVYSKDMAKIPMHITRKKDVTTDGKNFAFMTANGGFGVSLLPYFSVNRIVVLKNFKGVHAVPYIRGGGEKGENWHKAGSKKYKQNSMNDFQAAAGYLIDKKYTSPELLAVDGGASGTSGPLIGASLNQAPNLFGAVIAEAGVMDMLRFDQFDIGIDWVPEYGSPQNKDDVQYLAKYSPLHTVDIRETRQYPATLLVTSAHDGRVPALHSLKFIATLQNEALKKKSIQKNPLLIKISKSGITSLEEAVDITLFIVKNTGIKFQP